MISLVQFPLSQFLQSLVDLILQLLVDHLSLRYVCHCFIASFSHRYAALQELVLVGTRLRRRCNIGLRWLIEHGLVRCCRTAGCRVQHAALKTKSTQAGALGLASRSQPFICLHWLLSHCFFPVWLSFGTRHDQFLVRKLLNLRFCWAIFRVLHIIRTDSIQVTRRRAELLILLTEYFSRRNVLWLDVVHPLLRYVRLRDVSRRWHVYIVHKIINNSALLVLNAAVAVSHLGFVTWLGQLLVLGVPILVCRPSQVERAAGSCATELASCSDGSALATFGIADRSVGSTFSCLGHLVRPAATLLAVLGAGSATWTDAVCALPIDNTICRRCQHLDAAIGIDRDAARSLVFCRCTDPIFNHRCECIMGKSASATLGMVHHSTLCQGRLAHRGALFGS